MVALNKLWGGEEEIELFVLSGAQFIAQLSSCQQFLFTSFYSLSTHQDSPGGFF